MPAMPRRGAIAAAAAFALAPKLAAGQAAAPGFPDRPLRILVPYDAGGITDVMSRAVAQALTPLLGQPVVVENRPGANGSVGTLAAARSAPDGHTLTMGITDIVAINPSTFRNLPYDPEPSTPEEPAAFQKREREQWAAVVRNAKIVAE